MGIDNDSKLIVGFNLDENKVKEFMKKHDVEDYSCVTDLINELYPEMKGFIYVECAGNAYSGLYEFYLTFFRHGTKIGKIKGVTSKHLEFAKKIYKEITSKELKCENIDDVDVFSVNYTW